MTDIRVKRERFLPFAYDRHGLRTTIERVELDGHLVEDGFDQDSHIIDVRGPWTHARLEFEIRAVAGLIEHVVGEDERDRPPLDVLLAIRCDATRLRRGMKRPFVPEHPTTVELVLERNDLMGQAELLPFLVRAQTAQETLSAHATLAGARVAEGRAWILRTDLERTPSGRYLDVRFKSFADDEVIPAWERGALWRIEPLHEIPILWLNRDHATIATLLTNESSRGRRAWLREILFDRISASVWMRLFLVALKVLDQDEETYGWEHAVLDHLLPAMYPNAPTTAARLEYLEQERGELLDLIGRLDTALQLRDEGIIHITRLVEDL